MTCLYCGTVIVGFCCATCGWRPRDADATGDTGEDDYPYAHDDSPLGPWRPDEDSD